MLSEYNSYINLIVTALIGLVTLFLVRFYVKVFSLPRGPFPFPIVGNILLFRGTKIPVYETIYNLRTKYGSMYTIWTGMTPTVFVNDLELIKEAFNSKNNEFMGRPNRLIKKLLTQEKGFDVVFSDHGPEWASLRRVAHSAARKLAVSDRLAYLAADSIDDTVKTILAKEGIGKSFNPIEYIYLTVFNIIASSAFGKRFSVNDPEFKLIKNNFEIFRQNSTPIALVNQLPVLKLYYNKAYKQTVEAINSIIKVSRDNYAEHVKSHEPGIVRDFCDGLIEAKEEAVREEKESAFYLNDFNLSLVINDLFIAGSDTTNFTMRWIILLMANYTDMQMKMRKEIAEVIGDRMPLHEDRGKCHFVNAFITETLRFRPVVTVGVPHRAMCDAYINKQRIAKDTLVIGFIWDVHNNHQYWTNPDLFKPERFLTSDGKFNEIKYPALIPFGVGRRICLGEKLALADLFMMTVRLLQSTSDYIIELPDGCGTADLSPDPNVGVTCSPKSFNILLKKMNNN